MFLVNNGGRIIDVPARMEEDAFYQAKEVLSISSELMNGIASGVAMSDYDAMVLKRKILEKFPNVITDEEYLEKHPPKTVEVVKREPIPKSVIEKGFPIVDTVKESVLVNEAMTKKQILATAIENGVELNKQEERFAKNKLIDIINDRNKR